MLPALKDLPEIINDYGMIRIKKLRSWVNYNDNVTNSDIVEVYRNWRDTSEHIVLEGWTNYIMDLNGVQKYPEKFYFLAKAAKRGNDVYRALVAGKWRRAEEIPPVELFNDEWADKTTPMLSFTLTYAAGRSPCEAAWKTFGEDFHLWLAKLKQAYGDFEYIRCWESTNNFYPHAHVLVAFKNHSFPVFERYDRDGNRYWALSDADDKKLSCYWHSFSKIRGVQDTGSTLKHLVKYITKEIFTKKGDKTNAMLWYHGKQAYAISRGFFDLLKLSFAKPKPGEPQTADLIKPIMHNCNINFEFIGIFPSKLLKVNSNEWFFKMKDPPPEAAMAFWYEQNMR